VTLREVLESVVAGLDPAPDAAVLPDGSTEWSRDGVVFAALEGTGDVVAFRLDETLAAAAQRTPDTGPTPRGNPWVVFGPGVIDDHAIDRARAWFEAAYRRAVTGRA
jgi:hypothetical protein